MGKKLSKRLSKYGVLARNTATLFRHQIWSRKIKQGNPSKVRTIIQNIIKKKDKADGNIKPLQAL